MTFATMNIIYHGFLEKLILKIILIIMKLSSIDVMMSFSIKKDCMGMDKFSTVIIQPGDRFTE